MFGLGGFFCSGQWNILGRMKVVFRGRRKRRKKVSLSRPVGEQSGSRAGRLSQSSPSCMYVHALTIVCGSSSSAKLIGKEKEGRILEPGSIDDACAWSYWCRFRIPRKWAWKREAQLSGSVFADALLFIHKMVLNLHSYLQCGSVALSPIFLNIIIYNGFYVF